MDLLWALFCFKGTAGSTEVKSFSVFNCTSKQTLPSKRLFFFSPGDVEVVEQLSLREAFLQEAVGLFGSHLGHGAVDFSRGHVRPLHQTSYASHAAARGEGRGWERVTEGFVRAAAQRESLD